MINTRLGPLLKTPWVQLSGQQLHGGKIGDAGSRAERAKTRTEATGVGVVAPAGATEAPLTL